MQEGYHKLSELPANKQDTYDGCGHGTAVAGVIGAACGNKKGITGIATCKEAGLYNPKCKIMALKIWDQNDDITDSYQIKALSYAIQNGADVINMSYGGKVRKQSVEE